MKITEITSISKYLIGAIPIGMGTTAICFLMPNGKVLKIYYNKILKDYMISNIEAFSIIGNDTYITPEELLIKNGLCIGQIYEYIPSKTLHDVISDITISDILKGYDKLISDTKLISDKLFMLKDLHDKNILFDGTFYVIDLDKGYISDSFPKKNVTDINILKVNEVILYTLLGIKSYQTIKFCDPILQKKYSESLSFVEEFPMLLEMINEKSDEVEIKKLTKKIKIETSFNTYYKF